MKKRYFIVSPTEAGVDVGDTLWQLCRTVSKGSIRDIYDRDDYDVVADGVTKGWVMQAANRRGSKNPKII